MAPYRNASFLLAFAALAGCGGDSAISGGAHVRFFDALGDGSSNVRLVVGGRTYEAAGDTSFSNGQSPQYDDVLSGTKDVYVNKYSNMSTSGNNALASATAQSFVEGRNYTVFASVASSSSTTPKVQVLTDGGTIASAGDAYFRIFDGYSKSNAIYVRIFKGATPIYQTGTTNGPQTGNVTGGFLSNADATNTSYTIRFYTSSTDVATKVGSDHTVTLTPGRQLSLFLYDDPGKTDDLGLRDDVDPLTTG